MLKRDSSHIWSSTDDSHHPTAFNLRRVWQRLRQKSLWPTWKQHQIYYRAQWKGKKKKFFKKLPNEEASTLVPLATRCTLINTAAFTTFIYVSRGPLFLVLFCWTVHSQISGLHEWTRQRWCMYSKLRGCASVCFSPHNEERAISSVQLVSVWWHRWRPFKPKILLGIGLSDLAASPSLGPIRPLFSHYLFFPLIRLRSCHLLIFSTLQLHSGLRFAQGEGKIMGNKVSTLAGAPRCWCEEEGKQCSEVTFKQRGH